MAIDCNNPCSCIQDGMLRTEQGFRFRLMQVLCGIVTNGLPISTTPATLKEAAFSTSVDILASAITAGYANPTVLPTDTLSLTFQNETNSDVWVSMGGGTDHYHVNAGMTRDVPLQALGLKTNATVTVKRGAYWDASPAGLFRISSIS